jgi:hypothetical protein
MARGTYGKGARANSETGERLEASASATQDS